VRRLLVTGMSGVGKSTALRGLAALGHRTVDADGDGWSRWLPGPDGTPEWAWDESRVAELLAEPLPLGGGLVVGGTAFNQGRFYDRFDAVVLLSAPAEVMLARIDARTDNDFGRSPEQRAQVLRDLAEVEPVLRAGATHEITTTRPLAEVVAELDALVRSEIR
jgi:shikimate kinase